MPLDDEEQAMKAVWYERKGAADEVLQIGELPKPQPAAGEVLVEIRASGVNPSDTKGRGGARGATAMPFPRIVPHQDGAGVIVAVGDGVDRARIGERVWIYEAQLGRPFGTAAEFTAVPAEKAVRLPEGASFEAGACLGVPALTAHQAVFADGAVDGQTVLVTGGAGAVGFYAVQFAKRGGARVVATVSNDTQAALARQAGAELVLRRDHPDLSAAIGPRSVDRIVEVAFGANLATTLKVLKPGGVIAAYASDAEPEPALPFWPLVGLNAVLRFVLVYVMSRAAHREAVGYVTQALAEGWLQHNIAATLPLDAAADAHARVERGAGGKVVLTL
jgi:NADPH2:quinone reductase